MSKRKASIAIVAITTLLLPLVVAISPAHAKKKKLPKQEATTEPSIKNFKEGVERMKNGDLDGAIDSLVQACYFARNNYAPIAWFWLGICYKEKKMDSKAIDALKKHIEQCLGGSPEAHIALAEIYMRQDRDFEAENEIKTALTETQGPAPRAHNMYGKLAEKKKDWSTAVWHYKEALGSRPWTYTEAWMNFNECQMKQKLWGPAILQFETMLHSPVPLKGLNKERIYMDLGVCNLQKGNHQSAIDNWHFALEENPENVEAHFLLGQLLDSEKHISAAVKEYKEFVRLTPEDDKRAQAVRDRIAKLEQSLSPAEAEPERAKPSVYMMQMRAEKERQRQQMQEYMEKTKDSLVNPGGDPGF